MQSDELRLLTASEPLTLSEEYEMQSRYKYPCAQYALTYIKKFTIFSEKWKNDDDSKAATFHLACPDNRLQSLRL